MSGGNGSEENPLSKQLGEEIVWIWSVKNDGEQDVTILGWECDLLHCSSMINLSPDFCAGYSSNILVRSMLPYTFVFCACTAVFLLSCT